MAESLTGWWKKQLKAPQRPPALKSRSFNSPGETAIRQQRDEFIAAQNRFGYGNEVFGVPLEASIDVAESLISVPSKDPGDFVRYGRIPLLVGKCGAFLKDKGLSMEGVFRVAGSSRRVKELQWKFSTPPAYGRKLNWEGYTVHDAASLFRRFLNSLPEPLVPLALYEEFREPVRSRPRILQHIQQRSDTLEKRLRGVQLNEGAEETADKSGKELRRQKRIAKDLRSALKEFRVLIDKLPEANRHLLYYLLDLLTMFADNASKNLMPARNLAAIFQPSILSHPEHDLTPGEYALSQAVVEVLIEYSKRLLPDIKGKMSSTQLSLLTSQATSRVPSSTHLSTAASSTQLSVPTTRPHSRSLSAANGIPESINPTTLTTHTNKSEILSNASSDEDEDDLTKVINLNSPSSTIENFDLTTRHESEQELRESRWDQEGSPKRESWFKRIRSPARG